MIPQWFWKSVLPSGIYTLEKNFEPAKNKGGGIRAGRETPEHVQLDCCLSCNKSLNDRFEVPCRPSVEKMMRGEALSAAEAELAALWFLKTGLLLAFPTPKSGWGTSEVAWSQATYDESLYSWMIDNTLPPDGLSLLLHRFAPDRQLGSEAALRLPKVVLGERELISQGFDFQLHNWGFTLISHPGWLFEHPNAGGDALARLWPATGDVDVSVLKPRLLWPLSFSPGPQLEFTEEYALSSLPILVADMDFNEIADASVLPTWSMPTSK